MALGRRKREQQDLWVATCDLPKSPGHPFYSKLNRLLDESGFDAFVENLCKPSYANGRGRPSIPPGVYFRMLFIGFFEGLDSQRAIAWRCSDSRSLQSFLGYDITATIVPDGAWTPDWASVYEPYGAGESPISEGSPRARTARRRGNRRAVSRFDRSHIQRSRQR